MVQTLMNITNSSHEKWRQSKQQDSIGGNVESKQKENMKYEVKNASGVYVCAPVRVCSTSTNFNNEEN